MELLKAAYINEMIKILKRKKLSVLMVLSFLFVLGSTIGVYLLNNLSGIRITGSSEFSIMVLSILVYSLFPLFAIFLCVDMFAGEFADLTIKLTLTGPASRFKVFLSKILTAATLIIGSLYFVMIISIIASIIINKDMPNLLRIFVSYTMAFMPIFVFSLVVILISNIAKGTTSAFMFSIFMFLLLNGLSLVFPQIRSFLFTSNFDWYRLVLGSYINFSKILRVLLILLGYCIMLIVGSSYLFERKDI
ncbi:MAG: ABC transporter permease [Clostridiales bacterium]|nr:ABC transporter permease [Clostridiales bacterium]